MHWAALSRHGERGAFWASLVRKLWPPNLLEADLAAEISFLYHVNGKADLFVTKFDLERVKAHDVCRGMLLNVLELSLKLGVEHKISVNGQPVNLTDLVKK